MQRPTYCLSPRAFSTFFADTTLNTVSSSSSRTRRAAWQNAKVLILRATADFMTSSVNGGFILTSYRRFIQRVREWSANHSHPVVFRRIASLYCLSANLDQRQRALLQKTLGTACPILGLEKASSIFAALLERHSEPELTERLRALLPMNQTIAEAVLLAIFPEESSLDLMSAPPDFISELSETFSAALFEKCQSCGPISKRWTELLASKLPGIVSAMEPTGNALPAANHVSTPSSHPQWSDISEDLQAQDPALIAHGLYSVRRNFDMWEHEPAKVSEMVHLLLQVLMHDDRYLCMTSSDCFTWPVLCT